MRAVLACAVLAAAGIGLSGCEPQQVVVYKQGKYQGKPDTKPWEGAPFGGSEAEWERAIQTRTLGQNEYNRIGG
jgi:hypothetical protein